MTSVLIALADVGPGVQLEEQLAKAQLVARWDAQLADGPRSGGDHTVVLVDADHLGTRLVDICERWRDQPSVPGVVAMGSSAVAREQAPRARVVLLSPGATIAVVVSALRDAERLRLASGMRWSMLRAAVGLRPAADEPAQWQTTLAACRKVDIEIPRNALRWHAQHYASPTARLDQLREERLLTVPELGAAAKLDGTLTVQSLVRFGPLDPQQTARFLWTLASMGAIELTPEIRDVGTIERRTVADLRAHLRARAIRLERSTYYDVLEISPLAEYGEIEEAYRLVGERFSPDALSQYDLAELAPSIKPMWELVEKARSVLVDDPARGRYNDWLRAKIRELRTTWAIDATAATTAAEVFARGQRSLGEGEVHRAMSELAMACRQFPGHPEYEANLAWARYRVQVASGRDRVEAAVLERKTIEELLLGCRPWPRALVALALLCASAGDADTARWHLHVALTTDPTLPAAAQLAHRLGMRAYGK